MKFDSLWLRLGMLGGVVGFGFALRWFAQKRRTRRIEVGPVSEAWLSEQKRKTTETW